MQFTAREEVLLFLIRMEFIHISKTTNVPESVIQLTFESFGVFNRLNRKNIENEINRLESS